MLEDEINQFNSILDKNHSKKKNSKKKKNNSQGNPCYFQND
jgi:hypothetical protein